MHHHRVVIVTGAPVVTIVATGSAWFIARIRHGPFETRLTIHVDLALCALHGEGEKERERREHRALASERGGVATPGAVELRRRYGYGRRHGGVLAPAATLEVTTIDCRHLYNFLF